jgi:hypothetical protein
MRFWTLADRQSSTYTEIIILLFFYFKISRYSRLIIYRRSTTAFNMPQGKHENKLHSTDVDCRLNDGRVVDEFKPIFRELRETGVTTGEGLTGCRTCIQMHFDDEYAYYMGKSGDRYIKYSSKKVAEMILQAADKEGIEYEWTDDADKAIVLKDPVR